MCMSLHAVHVSPALPCPFLSSMCLEYLWNLSIGAEHSMWMHAWIGFEKILETKQWKIIFSISWLFSQVSNVYVLLQHNEQTPVTKAKETKPNGEEHKNQPIFKKSCSCFLSTNNCFTVTREALSIQTITLKWLTWIKKRQLCCLFILFTVWHPKLLRLKQI